MLTKCLIDTVGRVAVGVAILLGVLVVAAVPLGAQAGRAEMNCTIPGPCSSAFGTPSNLGSH